ncbi:MAG: putative DNA binding domain-containing protein [Ignavibacteria bacterium]|nr:putative DNA binding domain-containing protein [Ignavibacteria bacterium]
MITKEELDILLSNIESDRVERTTSISDTNKFCEAICSFSNDLPNYRLPGYLLIGVIDNGSLSGLTITDQLLQNLSSLRSDGNILPLPAINVAKFIYPTGEVAVVEVLPSNLPPVRYKGRVCIRVGPRKGTATEQEERILTEKRIAQAKSFDAQPCLEASLKDLNLDIFKTTYLPLAVEKRIIEENNREIKEQLSSLRFYDSQNDCPTNAGILLFGNNPLFFIPGAYIQYVKYEGIELSSDVVSEKEFSGELVSMLRLLDEFVATLVESKPIANSALTEETFSDYPVMALRELIMNAVMHRDYQSNAPVKFYYFEDHIEIQNPGGLYGAARPENFPNQNDYRNPIIAEALKTLGYVNKFSRGVIRAEEQLMKNHNPEPIFELSQQTYLNVIIKKRS